MIRKIALAAVPVAALGGLMLGTGAANAGGVQYANGAALGTGAAASYSNGTWTLDSGHGAGGSAQVDLVKPPTATTAPTFTASTEYAGNPRWVIEFHNGDYLFGYPPAGSNESTLSWTLEPAGTAETSYAAALAAAQAGGADDQVTSAFIVLDTGNPDATVNLTGVTYNGENVVQAVPPTYVYDGRPHYVAPTRENITFKENIGTWVEFVIHGPGLINDHHGWVPAKGGGVLNTGVYSGLEAHHGYGVTYTPVVAQGSSVPVPNSHGGTAFFVSDQPGT